MPFPSQRLGYKTYIAEKGSNCKNDLFENLCYVRICIKIWTFIKSTDNFVIILLFKKKS